MSFTKLGREARERERRAREHAARQFVNAVPLRVTPGNLIEALALSPLLTVDTERGTVVAISPRAVMPLRANQ